VKKGFILFNFRPESEVVKLLKSTIEKWGRVAWGIEEGLLFEMIGKINPLKGCESFIEKTLRAQAVRKGI